MRERERLHTKLLVQTLSPEGGLLPPHRGGRRDDERGLDWFFVATEACDGGNSDLG